MSDLLRPRLRLVSFSSNGCEFTDYKLIYESNQFTDINRRHWTIGSNKLPETSIIGLIAIKDVTEKPVL